jgi:Uma2 family endonuclease
MPTLLEPPPVVRQAERVAQPEPASPLKPVSPPERSHVVLNSVPWSSYVIIGEALQDRSGLHITFDRGSLEIMTLSPEHEGGSSLLNRLLEILAEEMNLPMINLGSTTFQREDLDRGLEPDRCYYIANLAKMRGVRRIDLNRDPPPDLAVEVEVSRSVLNRLAIYAALRVPEVWRFDGNAIQVLRLNEAGSYDAVPRSPTFPAVTPEELLPFIRQGWDEDDTTMARAFRKWIRSRLDNPLP